MNLVQLEYLSAVLQEDSLRATAARLHASPSAVLRQLRSLEASLGIPLFVVKRRRLTATPEGRKIGEAAQRVLAEVRSLRELADSMSKGSVGSVTVGCHSLHIVRFLGVASQLFRDRHPDIAVRLLEPTERLPNRPFQPSDLEAGSEMDFIMTTKVNDQTLSLEIWTTSIVVVGTTEDPLRHKSSVTLDDIRSRRIFALPTTAWSRQQLDSLALAHNYELDLVEEDRCDVLVARAIAGMGVAVIPDDNLASGATFPKLMDESGNAFNTAVRLVWSAEHPLSPAANTFLRFATEHREEILRHASTPLELHN